jgi:hypothetical protein
MWNSPKMRFGFESANGSLWKYRLNNQNEKMLILVTRNKQKTSKVCDCLDIQALFSFYKHDPAAKLYFRLLKESVLLNQLNSPKILRHSYRYFWNGFF